MTWLFGDANLERRRWFEPSGPIAGRTSWITHPAPWLPGGGKQLSCNSLAFVLAASRGAVLASMASWQGHLAARFGALTAWSVLDRSPAAGKMSLNPNLAGLKDYFGLSAKGTIGAGFAILEMQAAGYKFFGHWEEAFCLPGLKGPDFVFGRRGSLAAVEAKCTEQSDPNLEALLKSAWRDQVRDSGIWGVDEGWVIAACFNNPAGAALERVYRAFNPPVVAGSPPDANLAPSCMTTRSAMHSALLGMADWVTPFLAEVAEPENNLRVRAQGDADSLIAMVNNLLQTGRRLELDVTSVSVLLGDSVSIPTGSGFFLSMTPFCTVEALAALAESLSRENRPEWPQLAFPGGREVTPKVPNLEIGSKPVEIWLADGTGARFTFGSR